jgi:hypothetical protein
MKLEYRPKGFAFQAETDFEKSMLQRIHCQMFRANSINKDILSFEHVTPVKAATKARAVLDKIEQEKWDAKEAGEEFRKVLEGIANSDCI